MKRFRNQCTKNLETWQRRAANPQKLASETTPTDATTPYPPRPPGHFMTAFPSTLPSVQWSPQLANSTSWSSACNTTSYFSSSSSTRASSGSSSSMESCEGTPSPSASPSGSSLCLLSPGSDVSNFTYNSDHTGGGRSIMSVTTAASTSSMQHQAECTNIMRRAADKAVPSKRFVNRNSWSPTVYASMASSGITGAGNSMGSLSGVGEAQRSIGLVVSTAGVPVGSGTRGSSNLAISSTV
jgi:hypothetical protein